jgi:hypothetical protein
MLPIQSLKQVKMIEVPGKKIELKLFTDLDEQNNILKQHG